MTKRALVSVLSAFVFLLLVACSAQSPLGAAEELTTQGNVRVVHGGDGLVFSKDGLSLTLEAELVGLLPGRDVQVTMNVDDLILVDVSCTGPGGRQAAPTGSPLLSLQGVTDLAGAEVAAVTTPFSLTVAPASSIVAGAPDCPEAGNWTEEIIGINWTTSFFRLEVSQDSNKGAESVLVIGGGTLNDFSEVGGEIFYVAPVEEPVPGWR